MFDFIGMQNQEPLVYVAVLNWFKYETTAACLRTLVAMDYPRVQIIVVDNGSTNGSAEKLRAEFPHLRILETGENLGYAGGNKWVSDLALSEGADLLWVLNNDTTVRPNALSALVKAYLTFGEAVYSNTTLLSEHPDVIHYAGTYAPDELSDPANPYDKLKGELLASCWEKLTDREARIYGHSLLIPVTVIAKYGFMDTGFFMFCEEEDYFLQLKKHGIPTRYVRDAIILHESSGSFKGKTGSLHQGMKLPLVYYGKRNKYFMKMRWEGQAPSLALQDRGGWWTLVKFFIKFRLSSKEKRASMMEDYMWNLAAWHAWKGVRGKTLDPADYRDAVG